MWLNPLLSPIVYGFMSATATVAATTVTAVTTVAAVAVIA